MAQPEPCTPSEPPCGTPPSSDALTSVGNWLARHGPTPPSEHLRALGLGAYGYTQLRAGEPERASLRPAFLASVARHHRIRAELRPLFQAWANAGVEFMVFKGFHLSEWVYPVPGTRFHGDVDVLVRPADVACALAVADALGWRRRAARPEGDRICYHEAGSLYSPGGETLVELHRWAVHRSLSLERAQRRITRAVWAAARHVELDGVRFRVPSDRDAIIVGLALQRCWGGDAWCLKPHDAADLRLLLARGVRDADLWERARELRCERTLRIFLARCIPERGPVPLGAPTREERQNWEREMAREAVSPRVRAAVSRMLRAPRVAAWTLAALGDVVRVRRILRAEQDLHRVLEALSGPAPAAPVTLEARARAVRGIRWATRLLPTNPRGDCVVRSLALYAVLRRQGWPAVFVSGVRREQGGIVGHAWVELDGGELIELREHGNRARYALAFVYPHRG